MGKTCRLKQETYLGVLGSVPYVPNTFFFLEIH